MMDEPKDSPMGRRTTFTPEIGAKICRHLAAGMSLAEVSRLPGMPPVTTLSDWAWNPKHSDPDFVGDYARAKETQAHLTFDRLKDLETRMEEGNLDPHVGRAVIDSIKWRFAKMMPRVYGDRSHLEVSGGLKVETVKDHAPEWMQDRLAGLAPAATASDDEDEDTIIH